MNDEGKTKKELITELNELRAKLRQRAARANFDLVTGLPNRTLLYDRLTQSLLQGRRTGKRVAVMFIRLDSLRVINQTFGSGTGDSILKETAGRLLDCLRKSDTVARPGRDEFIVLLPEIAVARDTIIVAEKILGALDEPFRRNNTDIYVNVNIGISYFPDDGIEASKVLKNAYTALEHSIKDGKNMYSFFSPIMNAEAQERIVLQNDLRKALRRKEFVLRYQPQIDVRSGNIVGVEALIRWRKPRQGIVMPGNFISAAEESGLIVPIGEWSLDAACRQYMKWLRRGIAPGRVAVNVSARQLMHGDLVSTVEKVLKRTGMPPECLDLEMTEKVVFQDDWSVWNVLTRLKDMGINISIDDFGTGYSSLSYLKQFPVKKLKIVRDFVTSISINPIDSAIAKLIVELSHTLNLRVIAEGVETRDQFNLLRSLGCDEVQGFLFYRPLTPGNATNVLQKKAAESLKSPGRAEGREVDRLRPVRVIK